MTMLYQIRFFGPPQVEKGNQSLPSAVLGSRKGLALLAYLACHREPLSRTHLADLFWPDKEELRGRRNLSRELSQLAVYLPGCLESDAHTIQFHPGSAYWLDIWTFEELTQEVDIPNLQTLQDSWNILAPPSHKERPEPDPAKLMEAIGLYRGDFLAGLYLDGCPEFESWLIKEQEFWRQRVIRVLEWLFTHFAFRRQDDQARKYLERWLVLEPWNEIPHRFLMILLARNGQRSAALAQYERCRRILEEELGVEPGPKAVALYEQIRAGDFVDKGTPPAPTPPVEPPEREQLEPEPLPPTLPVHNLPAALKSFFGREEELATLSAYLQNPETRLVSLVGMGGMGKTDLSLQAARSLLSAFKEGVWFVALAGVQPPVALPGEAPEAQLDRLHQALAIAIATALGLTLEGDQLPQAQIKTYLRDKALLLVMDNFEHLIEGALFLQELLLHAGQLKLLVTSRERLRLPGEWVLDLEGLPYPAKLTSRPELGLPDPEVHWTTAEGLNELAGFASVSLFVERARQGSAAFTLSAQNSGAVVRLCQLVEGMPLGLELLASQFRGFMPEQVVQAVEGNLTRLQSDLRTVPARHRNLQAVFEWSWSLLFPTQQRLFSQLSIFRGGFEAEAAQAVVGATWSDILELWERSLLRRHESGRLEMHELLSQFAQEKLTLYEAAYGGEAVQDRHSYYYITLLNLWEADLLDENLREALAECRRELDNIRQAWQWAISRDRFEWIGRSLSTIVSIYDLLGLFQEAVTILEAATARARAREAVTTNPAEVKTLQKLWGQLLVEQSHFLYKQARYERLAEMAQALLELGEWSGLVDLTISGYLQRGKAQLGQGQYEAGRQELEQSLAMAHEAELPLLVADSLYFLGTIYQHQGRRDESKQYFEQALAYYRQQGHQPDEEEIQNWLLTFAANQDYAQGKAYFEQRLNVARQRANPVNQARLLHLLARLCLKLGEYDQARAYEAESLKIAETLERPWLVIPRLTGLSAITTGLGEVEAGLQYGYQALDAAKVVKSPTLESLVLITLGRLLGAQGEWEKATPLYEQALSLRQAQGKPEAVVETLAGLAGAALARRRLPQARAYVEEILTYLEAFKLELLDEPFTLCLACYHVLQAVQDPRAEPLLRQAHTLLQTRAIRISDDALRHAFLENVPANREIIALYRLSVLSTDK